MGYELQDSSRRRRRRRRRFAALGWRPGQGWGKVPHRAPTFLPPWSSSSSSSALRLRCACAAGRKKRAYVHLSLVYGVSRDFLRQSESTRPYPGALVRKTMKIEKLKNALGHVGELRSGFKHVREQRKTNINNHCYQIPVGSSWVAAG